MKREFGAEYNIYEPLIELGGQIRETGDDEDRRRTLQERSRKYIKALLFRGQIPETPKINLLDYAARQAHLAQLLAVDCVCEGRSTQCKDYAKGKECLIRWYYAGDLQNPRGDYQQFLYKRRRWLGDILSFVNYRETVIPSIPDISLFPPGSWAIQVHFTLRKPYLSKDDVDFYIIDNPVKKEWVFKVPYVAPSQWKGALRSAMMQDLVSGLHSGRVSEAGFVQERLRLYRLFGNEKDGTAEFINRAWVFYRVGPRPEDDRRAREWEEKFKRTCEQVEREFEDRLRDKGYRVGDVKGFRGRLNFCPTFFDRVGLEVINPHDRKTGAGKQPIYFECVPAGTLGVFALLYVPLDAGPKDKQSVQADLEAVARGIRAVLTQYGFGAKTSSGYGVADILKDQSQIVPPDLEETFWKAWEENNA